MISTDMDLDEELYGTILLGKLLDIHCKGICDLLHVKYKSRGWDFIGRKKVFKINVELKE